METLNGKRILVTGGTGSFGKKFVQTVLENFEPKRLVIYSRDELKQFEMSQVVSPDRHSSLRYFIGDVRDQDRLRRAMSGVDIVVHAAALKQVPACEYNPIEAIKTNIHGAEAIINASIDAGVEKVLALSTDKAVNPVNLYGATKLVAEKLFVQGNAYSGAKGTRFSCVRYGNVMGSRGSVIPLFLRQRETGRITVTDPRMTRFWITLDQGVRFVISSIELMKGGEVFIPKIPSMSVTDIIKAVAPHCKVDNIGIRPGEKLHEMLLSMDEARHSLELEDRFVIQPQHPFWDNKNWDTGKKLADGFFYSSDNNDTWLTPEDIRKLLPDLT